MHQDFDALSRVSPDQRSRTDQINNVVFETLERWLANTVFEKLKNLRHKFIAHAADAASRAKVSLDSIGITLGEIETAQRILIQSVEVISAKILSSSHYGQIIPIPQFDQFQALDAPFVPSQAINRLSDWWQKHTESRAQWTRGKLIE